MNGELIAHEDDVFTMLEDGTLEQRWQHPTLGEMVTVIKPPFTGFNLVPYEDTDGR